jgi:hypothetical protein
MSKLPDRREEETLMDRLANSSITLMAAMRACTDLNIHKGQNSLSRSSLPDDSGINTVGRESTLEYPVLLPALLPAPTTETCIRSPNELKLVI